MRRSKSQEAINGLMHTTELDASALIDKNYSILSQFKVRPQM